MEEEQGFLGELRLGRTLTSVGQVSAGGLAIFLGVTLVISGWSLASLGGLAALGALMAVLFLGLTTLSKLELLAGSGERGGSYPVIHEVMGGFWGFIAGWSLLVGEMLLSALLLRSTINHALLILPPIPWDPRWLAAALLLFVLMVQLFHLIPRRDWFWPFLLLLFFLFSLALFSALPELGVQNSGETPPVAGSGSFMQTVAWMVLGFAGLESASAIRRQVRNPNRLLPRAWALTLFGGGVASLLVLTITANLPVSEGLSLETWVARVISDQSRIPGEVTPLAMVGILLLSADVTLMLAVRQLHALSRQGVIPRALRRVLPPFRVPPLLFLGIAGFGVPLVILPETDWLLNLGGFSFLIALILLNITAIESRRREPDRRRVIVLPLAPLVPAVAIGLGLALILSIPGWHLINGIGGVVLAVLLYLVYGRSHLIEAQKGVLVFGREVERELEGESAYRILVPIEMGADRHLLLDLATAIARQTDGDAEVIPLQVIPVPDPLAIEEGRRIARERNTLFQWSTRLSSRSGVPTYPITRLARNVAEGILDTAVEEECRLILMGWLLPEDPQGERMGRIIDAVVRGAPCDIGVVAFHPERALPAAGEEVKGEGEGLHIERILVPTAGGPHAPLATRLAVQLAREYGASAGAVYVAGTTASEEDLARGQVMIENTLQAMREQVAELAAAREEAFEGIHIESQVVTAGSVVEGICQAGSASDLVLIGASEESFLDQVLFGTLAEQVAQLCPTPVMMVKRFRGLRRFWLQRVWDALFGTLPTLPERQRVDIYKQVRRGARPDIDFFVMIGLSAVIATYGLLQNSSAVIIGAMLVAPLFTPILAISLAVAQGDIRLLRIALESTIKGVALAIGVAVVLTAASPLRTLTREILVRTEPDLFDLAVALASGAAGAYAIARKDVAAALPGVAIAAALVPPLGVIGTGLAMGDTGIAGGGTLLFFTNLIAITLAGSITLVLLGFRPMDRREGRTRLRIGLLTSLALLLVIAIPLGVIFRQSVEESAIQQRIEGVLVDEWAANSQVSLVDFDFTKADSALQVEVTVYAGDRDTEELARSLKLALEAELEQEVVLQFIAIPVERQRLP